MSPIVLSFGLKPEESVIIGSVRCFLWTVKWGWCTTTRGSALGAESSRPSPGYKSFWLFKISTGCWVGGTTADLGEILKEVWEGKGTALVVYCCITTLPQTWWPKTGHIYYLASMSSVPVSLTKQPSECRPELKSHLKAWLGGYNSQFMWLSEYSTLRAIGLRASVLIQKPPSVSCHVDLSKMAAWFITASKPRSLYRESANKMEVIVLHLNCGSDIPSPLPYSID